LIELSSANEPEVRRAAITAMGGVGADALLPALITALADEATRSEAETALAARPEAAFPALRAQFEQTDQPAPLRWRIPRAMARCSPSDALAALVAWLPHEPHGGIRYTLLLVLERLVRQHPTLAVDRAALRRSVDETVARAYRFIEARFWLSRG